MRVGDKVIIHAKIYPTGRLDVPGILEHEQINSQGEVYWSVSYGGEKFGGVWQEDRLTPIASLSILERVIYGAE